MSSGCKHFVAFIALLISFSVRSEITTNAVTKDPAAFFLNSVQPLLQSKCIGCHGEDKKNIEGELDMTTRAGLLKGGESGKAALIPGKPEESPMIRAVLRQEKLKMPPKDRNKLTEDEIGILRAWIAGGAVWADHTNAPAKWTYKEEDVWAFKPINDVTVPVLKNKNALVFTPIDSFIQTKLEEKGLKPAVLADRVTLIRRATFDLLGLPPTPEEIGAFIADKSPKAFDKVIERLLASPHYGEQWGRHWLDVVRYADTDGYSNDYERPNAWRYRDYVIRSFNRDKPYDEFVVEQIAGDECVSADATDQSSSEKLIAVGMLRMGPWEHTAMSVAAVTRQLFLDDVTSSVGTTFCGLTVGCARCHDHKFDPIPTKDYYRLQSIFAPTELTSRKVPFLPEENTAGFEQKIQEVESAKKALKTRISDITGKHDRAVKKFLQENGYKTLREVELEKKPKKDLGLTANDLSTEKVLRKRIEYRERELERYEARGFSISNGTAETNAQVHILVGGALEAPGEVVTPGVLTAVTHWAKNADGTFTEHPDGRRLKLAQWLVSRENPLTARVMVNRIWQYHFGKGIVKSSNNFGKMGDKPTHPELLDWLARYFVEHGWSIKEMHRLIMRSYVYQQGFMPKNPELTRQRDPEEKFLSHFQPRRLTAEELRDGMLAVSGELSSTMGGPPVFPDINLEAALQPRHIMGSLAPVYVPSKKREERNRRTIYSMQIRGMMNPFLQVFNAAPTENSCERRDETTVTPQVFALFNSQNAADAALAFAVRLQKLATKPTQQIENAFRLAYGRSATKEERDACAKHLEDLTKSHRTTKPVLYELPHKIEREMVEELTGEPFQFTEDWDVEGYENNVRSADVTPETRALADLCLVILNSNEFVYIY